jgi:hypothetical protein
LSEQFDRIASNADQAIGVPHAHTPGGRKGAPPRAMQWLAAGVCLWSLALTPMEAGTADGSMQMWALITAKLMLLCAGCCAIAGITPLRNVFVFVCAVSVLAVAPALPLEYAISKMLFAFSMVDCGLKSALVSAYARHYFAHS